MISNINSEKQMQDKTDKCFQVTTSWRLNTVSMACDSLPSSPEMVKRKRASSKEGEERTEEVQTGVHPFHGAGGQQARETFFGGEGGLVAMEMTRNVLDAPGCPCRLMGPKPGPVPQWFCHSFQNPKCQLVYQKDWECWSIPERKTEHSPLLE